MRQGPGVRLRLRRKDGLLPVSHPFSQNHHVGHMHDMPAHLERRIWRMSWQASAGRGASSTSFQSCSTGRGLRVSAISLPRTKMFARYIGSVRKLQQTRDTLHPYVLFIIKVMLSFTPLCTSTIYSWYILLTAVPIVPRLPPKRIHCCSSSGARAPCSQRHSSDVYTSHPESRAEIDAMAAASEVDEKAAHLLVRIPSKV